MKSSITQFASRPGFLEICEKWRKRAQCVPDEYMGDIYDGNIWKSFHSKDGWDFLSAPFNYLLTLNVDWFEPFERGIYAIGAIYLTLQNLPREIRYHIDNVILVGIIPGPREPNLNINSYLTPLVLELEDAWREGFNVISPEGVTITVRLALSCVSCDIPASRKVCGFLGHNASLGCNKCFKKFDVTFANRSNFSGYDREKWVSRNKDDHNKRVQKVLEQTTKTGVESAESNNGVRYSVLLRLPYFDPINFTVVDVMHNLFLGTGKHMFNLWIERDILTKKMLLDMEEKISSFHVPAEVGRLPSHIGSLYGSFTAAQWRNWITLYSPIVLKGVIPDDHLRCWLLFVQACRILCSRVIRTVDLNSADLFLLHFCKTVEQIYGWEACTVNMHLHLHLKKCFEDFGPAHSFWCFSFERYNGILGSYRTNKRSVETQFMRKFCTEQKVRSLTITQDSVLQSVLPHSNLLQQTEQFFSLSNLFHDSNSILMIIRLPQEELRLVQSFQINGTISPLPPYQESVLNYKDVAYLKDLYQQLYKDRVMCNFSHYIVSFGKVLYAGDLIGSVKQGANNYLSSIIIAYWSLTTNNIYANCSRRVGEVQYFFKHIITFSDGDKESLEHVFAYVNWKKRHPKEDWYGSSAIVCTELNELSGSSSFLPVQRILFRCAHAVIKIDDESLFVACPIPVKFCI